MGLLQNNPRGDVPNQIGLYWHCSKCINELPEGMSPREWARTQTGYATGEDGAVIQVWCNRHDLAVATVSINPDVVKTLTEMSETLDAWSQEIADLYPQECRERCEHEGRPHCQWDDFYEVRDEHEGHLAELAVHLIHQVRETTEVPATQGDE